MSLENEMEKGYTELLMISLAHNAAVTEYASLIVSAGPAKSKEQHRKYIKEFRRIHDKCNADVIEVMEKMSKRVEPDGYGFGPNDKPYPEGTVGAELEKQARRQS